MPLLLGRRCFLVCTLAWAAGAQRIDYAEAGGPYVPETTPAARQPVPAATPAPAAVTEPLAAATPTRAPIPQLTAAEAAGPAVAVVAPPTTTATFTTTPLTLIPSTPDAVLQPGLVGELFDFKTKQTTVAVIDKTLHHWGDLYSALAMKWRGLFYIRNYGQYRFQITCLGAAELRINGVVIIKEDTLTSEKTSFASKPVMIAAGYHDILVGYTELEGQAGFAINYLGPDTSGVLKLIPPQAFLHEQGPCDLRTILAADSIACGNSEQPRWALGNGESCEVRCSWGRYPNGMPGSSSLVSCQNGALSPPNFFCALGSCALPKVAGAADQCAEGATVANGQPCTPKCLDGYEPRMSAPLQCRNGTMTGKFSCEPMHSCNAPEPKHIEHVGALPCFYGSSILHGARCGASCQPGYEPTADPLCKDGILDPPVFSCHPMALPQTTRPYAAYQAAAVFSTTPVDAGPLLGTGPGGTSAGPIIGLVAALLAAIVSAAACFCMAFSGKSQKSQSRGVQLNDSRPHSMSTDYSVRSVSDLEGRPSDDSNSEESDDASPPPSPPSRPQSRFAQAGSEKLLEEQRLAEQRRLEESRHREEQKRHAAAERRKAEERARQQREQEQARQPTERILGTSVRPLPPNRAPIHGRGHGQHRYQEEYGSDWSDVRAGDRNPRKANHVPWSDVRLS